jgi:hypothetical protein
MKNVVKQYSFIKKDMVSIKYFNWFKGAEDGSPNGSNDLKSKGLRVSKTKAVLQRRYGERPQGILLRRYSLLERRSSLIGLVVPPSLESVLRLSNGSLNRERLKISHPSLLYPGYSLVMGEQARLSQKGTAIASLIPILKRRRWGNCTRQTLLGQDISEAQKGLQDSILSILWMLQIIQLLRVNLPINRPSLCANISLKHGGLWESPMYLRWIMRWLLQVEDATPTVSPSLSVFICSWEFIWYSSLKESLAGMPLLRVSTHSGKKECLEDIIVLHLLSLKEPVNGFFGQSSRTTQ